MDYDRSLPQGCSTNWCNSFVSSLRHSAAEGPYIFLLLQSYGVIVGGWWWCGWRLDLLPLIPRVGVNLLAAPEWSFYDDAPSSSYLAVSIQVFQGKQKVNGMVHNVWKYLKREIRCAALGQLFHRSCMDCTDSTCKPEGL